MGLGNVCGKFDVLGVERFLADLRTYGKGDNHPQQAVIARMIELSEDFLSSQSPDIYTELEKDHIRSFAPRLVLRREDAYGETRRGESASGSRGSRSFSTKLRIPAAEHLLEFVVQDFGPRL